MFVKSVKRKTSPLERLVPTSLLHEVRFLGYAAEDTSCERGD